MLLDDWPVSGRESGDGSIIGLYGESPVLNIMQIIVLSDRSVPFNADGQSFRIVRDVLSETGTCTDSMSYQNIIYYLYQTIHRIKLNKPNRSLISQSKQKFEFARQINRLASRRREFKSKRAKTVYSGMVSAQVQNAAGLELICCNP